jgi:hypothetical protein
VGQSSSGGSTNQQSSLPADRDPQRWAVLACMTVPNVDMFCKLKAVNPD